LATHNRQSVYADHGLKVSPRPPKRNTVKHFFHLNETFKLLGAVLLQMRMPQSYWAFRYFDEEQGYGP
jgi:hypothetical protein